MNRLSFIVPAAALLALVAAPARAAVTKQQCVEADTAAQDLRRAGKLAEARAQLLVCNQAACPDLVRDDCTRRIDEIEQAQPTIVFAAKDGRGADVPAVRVSVDGRLLTEKLDGTPVPVDPGSHQFTFEVAGQPPVTRTFVIKEGEKRRREDVAVGAPPGEAPAPGPLADSAPARVAAPASPAETAAQAPGKGQRVAGAVVGGVGVAGLVVGGLFGFWASQAWNNAKSECGSTASCPNYPQAVTDHNLTITDGTASTVAFAAGGALVVTGAILYLTAPSSPVTAAIGPGGATVGLQGRF